MKFSHIAGSIGAIALVVGVVSSTEVIQPTEAGVMQTLGSLSQNELGPGLHFKLPFISTIRKYPTQLQSTTVNADAATSDLQSVLIKTKLTYQLKPNSGADFVRRFNGDFKSLDSQVIIPSLEESVKAASSRLTAEGLQTKRAEFKTTLNQELRDRLKGFGLNVNDVNVENLAYSKDFNAAIEAKLKAQQQALEAKSKADARIAKAEGDARSLELESKALTPQIAELRKAQMFADKWDGKLPVVMNGNGDSIPVLNITPQELTTAAKAGKVKK